MELFGMSGQSDVVGMPALQLRGDFIVPTDESAGAPDGWGFEPMSAFEETALVAQYPLDVPRVYGMRERVVSVGGGVAAPGPAGIPAGAVVSDIIIPSSITYSNGGSGKVTWTAGSVLYKGVTYTIAAEGTGDTNKYIYWNLNDTPTTLRTTNTRGTAVGADKFIMCVNDGGTPHPVGTGKLFWGDLITTDTLSAVSAQLGDVNAGTLTGTVITGGIFRTATRGRRIKIDSDGVKLMKSSASSGVVGTTANGGDNIVVGTTGNGGDNVIIGLGYLAVLYNMDKGVPLYIYTEQTVADIHLFNRNNTPSGAAEVGDKCVVQGKDRTCTVAGTPGTWVVTGDQAA